MGEKAPHRKQRMEPNADNRAAQDKKSSSAASAAEIAGKAALSAVLAT